MSDQRYNLRGVSASKEDVHNAIKNIDKGIFLTITNKELPVKGRRKKKNKKVRRQARANAGTSIEKRPEDIDTREEFGHWEMDTVVGKRGESKHSLLVLTERKTRNELIYLLYEHTTEQVCKRLDQLEAEWGERFGQVFKTITVDNGSEFADWEGMQPVSYTHLRAHET